MSSKFRVYDKQEKKYVDLKNNPLWMDNEGDFYFISDLPCCSCEGMSFYSDRYVVEFSTCKKDIKGNDIFYGDIVWAWCNPSGLTGRVQKRKCEVKPCKIFGGIELIILDYEKGEKWKTGRTDYSKGLEIIGNIHDGEADDKI